MFRDLSLCPGRCIYIHMCLWTFSRNKICSFMVRTLVAPPSLPTEKIEKLIQWLTYVKIKNISIRINPLITVRALFCIFYTYYLKHLVTYAIYMFCKVFHCVHFECPAQDGDTNHSPIRITNTKKPSSATASPSPPSTVSQRQLSQIHLQPTETAREAEELEAEDN